MQHDQVWKKQTNKQTIISVFSEMPSICLYAGFNKLSFYVM